MRDAANLMLIVLYIFFISGGLLMFFNLTTRYWHTLSAKYLLVLVLILGIVSLSLYNLFGFFNGFADSRNSQRSTDVQIISDAVDNFLTDYRYRLTELGQVPICPQVVHIGNGPGNLDIVSKLGDSSLSVLPLDPSGGTEADSQYTICITGSGRIEVAAPNAENNKVIVAKK
jgi:hypothetical protein